MSRSPRRHVAENVGNLAAIIWVICRADPTWHRIPQACSPKTGPRSRVPPGATTLIAQWTDNDLAAIESSTQEIGRHIFEPSGR